MKRSEILKESGKSERIIDMDLSELYLVKFVKTFGAFKAGDETYVSLPIAMKWIKQGVVGPSAEVTAAARSYKCEDLLKK